MTRLSPLFGLVIGLVAVTACGPADNSGGPGTGEGSPCTGSLTRCSGQSRQQCIDGAWTELEECADDLICTPNGGCTECDPSQSRVCLGSDIYQCNGGELGELVESCPVDGCSGGSCGGGDDCASGTQLIYVVDAEYRLHSFDPAEDRHTFQLIGNLSCPSAYPTWPGYDGGLGTPATPFSMSVDRHGVAWVLYTSGEIFHVSTDDASCQSSGYPRGQGGYELFGMGFVADESGSHTEKLAIAGGAAGSLEAGATELATVDPGPMSLAEVGAMPQGGEYSPELSGTGRGELYAYYPGSFSTSVAQIDRANGDAMMSWDLPGVSGSVVVAWAFAHWGGRFYIFVTSGEPDGLTGEVLDQNSEVYRLDPTTGDAQKILDHLPYTIVGAGVSTCAPVSID